MDGLIAYALAKKYTDKVGQDIISAGFKVQVEDNRSILNRQGEEKVLYLLPKEYSSSQDGYDEFVYANNRWELVGKTDVSLDYESLENKPTVQVNNSQIVPLSGKLRFTSGFSLGSYSPGELIRVDLRNISRDALYGWQEYFVGLQVWSDQSRTMHYDFNNLNVPSEMDFASAAGFFKCIGKSLVNTPQAFSDSISDDSRVLIIHYNTIPTNEQYHYLLRVIYFPDSTTNKIRQFAQWIYYKSELDTKVHAVTNWSEIGGGDQIVSGVVNANGTITFTDSEGDSFTTSGESVIGADGFSPVATVTQTASGATVSITDSSGTTTANISNGQDGNDYVLTAQDKSDIADIVLSELPTTEGVLYGNQSN